jgi:FkbM family methyltransferase
MAPRNIRARRGTSSDATSKIGLLKCIFISSLVLIIGFLIRLNYQLMSRLHEPDAAVVVSPGVSSAETQQKLNSLRNEVNAAKQKVDSMKSVVNELKGQSKDKPASSLLAKGNLSGYIDQDGVLPKITCSASQAEAQISRSNDRFREWWSHSACPDQAWMENIHHLFSSATLDADFVTSPELLTDHDKTRPFLILDIGCNKGYTSADFLDALSPGTGMNPHTLVKAIRQVAAEDKVKYDREGGVCNDADKPLNVDTKSIRNVEVHCFEPSPATYNMLTRVHDKLMKDDSDNSKAKWHIHNLGMHQVSGEMKWHSACKDSVGNELCGIVEEDTKDSITVPVVTVDEFLMDTYKTEKDELLPLVHMLKVDAEGLDPAVLTGSTKLLTQNRAMMVMFEFNPGLGEGGTFILLRNIHATCMCCTSATPFGSLFSLVPSSLWTHNILSTSAWNVGK